MILGISCICLIAIIASYLKERNIYNPVFVFSVIWFAMTFLYNFRLFDLREVSIYTKNCLMCTVVFFLIGSLLGSKIKFVLKHHENNKCVSHKISELTHDIDYNAVYILQIISFFILLYGALTDALGIIRGVSMSQYRYIILPTKVLNNSLYTNAVSYIAEPIVYLSVALFVISLIRKQRTITFYIMSIVLMVTHFLFTGGGRVLFLLLFIAIIVTLSAFIELSKISFITKFRFLLLAIAMIVIICYIAVARGGEWQKNLYYYLSGAIVSLDIHIDLFDGNYTNSLLAVQGFLRPLYLILGAIGLPVITDIDYAYKSIDKAIMLTSTQSFNSAVTATCYFYYEGGLLAIIILSFICGFVTQRYYRSTFYGNMSLSKFMIYILVIYFVSISFSSFPIATVKYAYAIVWILILRKIKIKKFRNIRS